MSRRVHSSRRAFSLVELLVVLAIISLLTAILLPVLATARSQARQTVCVSNLRQIGQGFAMYQQDYDGYFPYAADPAAHTRIEIMRLYFPQFAADIPRIGSIQDVLQPYVQSKEIFACPSDVGFENFENTDMGAGAAPTSYLQYGTSYYYRNVFAPCHTNDANLTHAATTSLMEDAVGFWHGSVSPVALRYNILFADGHVKNISEAQWLTIRCVIVNHIPLNEFDAAKVCAM